MRFVRFFAHDGRAVHGPSEPEELLRLPGFDGDTLVCPVGSEDSADWKPALSYPPFRAALLSPAPLTAPASPPPAPAPTRPCPACAHANPEGARFCNECAARIDGFVEPPPAPVFVPEPEPEPRALEFDSLVSPPEPAAEAAVPEAAAPAGRTSWRKTLIASFLGAAVVGAAMGWRLLRPAAKAAPAEPAQAATALPAAPLPAVPVAPAPPAEVAQPAPPPKAAAPAPAAVLPEAPKKRAPGKPRRKKPAAPRETKKEDARVQSPATAPEPAMPDGKSADGGSAAPSDPAAKAPADRAFLLPGIPRPVPPQSVVKAKTNPGAAHAADAAPAADAPEDSSAHQVREQFEFCAQLLAQGAYADHYDTCLCAVARQGLPYRGRRDFYAAALKKAEMAGTLETVATVSGIVLDGGIAKVTALWRTAASLTPGETRTESWQLEEGLWCRSP